MPDGVGAGGEKPPATRFGERVLATVSPFAASITWRISVAGLTHGNNVAEHISPTSCKPVNFPFSSKHGITPSGVMATRLHGAFAFSACSLEYIFSNTHFLPPILLTALSGWYAKLVVFTGFRLSSR